MADFTKIVSRRHPLYEENEEHWAFMLSCYKGGREWFAKDNIHKYKKEGAESYKARVKRAYRFNHTKEAVDLVNKYLFKKNPDRNTEDAPVGLRSFWKDVTGRKVSIEQFVKNISTYNSILGKVWVVVDSYADRPVITRADEESANMKVYAYTVLSEDALDMSFDEYGNLNWFLSREYYRKDDDPFVDEDELEVVVRYRLWTRQDWYLFEEVQQKDRRKKTTVELIDGGEHGLGIVPVTWADHLESDSYYTAPSMIADIAYLDRAIANYLSNFDVIIQEQTFSQLIMPAQAIEPEHGSANDSDSVKRKAKEIGTSEIFTFDSEAGIAPQYISPDVSQGELIISGIKMLINEIYHSVGLAGERTKQDNAVGIDNSSGVAKAYDFERINAMLIAKAEALDHFENRLIDIVCAYTGEKPKEDLVKYPKDFDVRGIADEFDIAANMMELDMPHESRRVQAEKLIKKILPTESESTMKKMIDELEDWPYVQDVVQAGGLANTSSRPTTSGSNGVRKPSRQGQVTSQTK